MENIIINIFDFTNAYKSQNFYKEYPHRYFDFTNLSSVNCYCDDEAFLTIKKEIYNRPVKDKRMINFLDNGNFHYLSYLTMSMIEQDFCLVLFDNHPDAKEPIFPILSCGGWVIDTLKNLSHLRKIVFIGVDPLLFDEINDIFDIYNFKQVRYDKDKRIYIYEAYNNTKPDYPVYLSIDKDVFDKEFASTMWSQGNMTFDEFKSFAKNTLGNKFILGIDITGEIGENTFDTRGNRLNEKANSLILKEIFKYF